MFRSKSRIALALALALASATPSIAMNMGGPQFLQMMEQIRADKAAPGSPLWVHVTVKKVNLRAKELTVRHAAVPQARMPAMTMTFSVADPTHLTMLHKGDPVDIEIANDNGVVKVLDFRMQH